MNILIVGAGMYVTGRNGSGVGTLLSAIVQCSKEYKITSVTIIATSSENAVIVSDISNKINSMLGAHTRIQYRQVSGDPHIDLPKLCGEIEFACGIICTPDHLHHDYAIVAMRLGLHLLVVKPLTVNLSEAKSLEQERKRLGLYGAVEFHKRWDVTNLWIRKALQDKAIGKLLCFTVDYSQKYTIPTRVFSGWVERTNIFQYLGVHYVDLIWFLTKFRPTRVMAIGVDGRLKGTGLNCWDAVLASIVWTNPRDNSETFVSQFTTSWVDPMATSALSDQKYKVIGSHGRIECDQKNRGLELVDDVRGIQQINPYFSEFLENGEQAMDFSGYGYDSVRQFIKDVNDIRSNKVSPNDLGAFRPTFRDALVSMSVVDAVNKSLVNHSNWQKIDESICS
jgi:predicted dehydrogenase